MLKALVYNFKMPQKMFRKTLLDVLCTYIVSLDYVVRKNTT